LAVADATLYTAPDHSSVVVETIILANTSGSTVSGIALAMNGTSATAANQFLSSSSLVANGQTVISSNGITTYDSGGNQQLAGAGNTAFDATIPAITTPLALGTAGTAATAPHRDHTHQSPGGVASIVAASAAITNTQVQVVGATIPATMLRVGTVLRFEASGTITSTVDNVITFRVRLGPTTLTGNIPASLAVHCGSTPGTATAAPFVIQVRVTIRTITANGTAYGAGSALGMPTAGVDQAFPYPVELFAPASVAVDCTVDNIAELTCVTAAATTAVTFQSAVIEIVRM